MSLLRQRLSFSGSAGFWERNYAQGRTSGNGSYGALAEGKRQFLNELVRARGVRSVIEFGCGDGNQLGMLECPSYTGLDVSATAIQRCKTSYAADSTKNFFLYDHRCFVDNRGIFKMDCSLSLDVLYHLVEKEVYDNYLKHLFASASKMVVIYAADIAIEHPTAHEKYRKFTQDVEKDIKGWKLKTTIKNKYPAKNNDDQEGSLADFFIYVPA